MKVNLIDIVKIIRDIMWTRVQVMECRESNVRFFLIMLPVGKKIEFLSFSVYISIVTEIS